MCFNRADGKLLWQSGVTYTEKEQTQPNNPYCSATPVTDGERVIASFGSAGLYCYDFDGQGTLASGPRQDERTCSAMPPRPFSGAISAS